jgi:DNA polymerase-3 subunit delta'
VDEIIGHADVLRELRTLADAPDPVHALLFAGPGGTGRTLLALEYARLLNCEARLPGGGGTLLGLLDSTTDAASGGACGQCRSCRLIGEGAHPDVITLGPGDTLCKPRPNESGHERHPQSRDIRICQVRGLIDLVARYPFEARYRMIIIDPADRLGREAANTLLKTLEEPPGHTVIALVTEAPDSLIETIVSRCRRIDVRPIPRAEIETALIKRGIEPGLASEVARECHGRPGRALDYAKSPDLMGDRARLLERCRKLAAAKTSERFTYAGELAERFRRDRTPVLAELNAWEAFWGDQLQRAAREDEAAVAGIVEALRAVVLVRADLLAQVMARPALELMLLSFPTLTLEEAVEEELATHA